MVIGVNFERFCNLREDHDLLQKDVADILNVCQQAYSKWETGKEVIPLEKLNSLCNYYNISFDYILKLSDNKNKIINIETLNKEEIGEKLKIIRNDNNLTLRDIAKELNTTPSTIWAYEHGKTLILTAFAYQICLKYNISLDWLC